MKWRVFLPLILLVVVLAVPQNNALMQSSSPVRRATTNIVSFEFSGSEPPPPGTLTTIGTVGYAGPAAYAIWAVPYLKVTPSIQWTYVPNAIELPPTWERDGAAIACGFDPSDQPSGQLRLPSGREIVLLGYEHIPRLENHPPDNTQKCWRYNAVTWEPGMELGGYSLTVTTASIQLNASWQMDYPSEPEILSIDPKNKSMAGTDGGWLLMGFAPNENLVINFYEEITQGRAAVGSPIGSRFYAQRHVRMDSDGAAVVVYKMSRSSSATLASRLDIVGFERASSGKLKRISNTLPTMQFPPTLAPRPTRTPVLLPLSTPTDAVSREPSDPLATIEKYYDDVNNRDFQSAYSVFMNPRQTFEEFRRGYSDTTQIKGYLGTFQPDAVVESKGRVPAILVGYQTKGRIVSYYGCYTVRQESGNWLIEDTRFVKLADREPTQAEIDTYTTKFDCLSFRKSS